MKTLRRVIAVISLVLIIVLSSYCVYTLNAYKENIQQEVVISEEIQSM